jgi:hypothetical protein
MATMCTKKDFPILIPAPSRRVGGEMEEIESINAIGIINASIDQWINGLILNIFHFTILDVWH